MKIEKGKLYLDTESKTVFKADFDLAVYNNLISDKIAVYCPTKEDWDYVRNKYGLSEWGFNIEFLYCYLEDENVSSDLQGCKNMKYHLITIDQFKEFYPESVISNKTEENVQNNDPINPTHYNQYSIQPLDYIEANGFDFCEGNVIKYVSRYKQKNGLEDLKKARVYLDKLINRYEK